MDKHYPPEAWIDFVRGLTVKSERTLMQAHRNECSLCDEVARQFDSIRQAVELDRTEGVPSEVLERAIGLFPAPSAVEPAWRRAFACLVQDSLDSALPAGVRSLGGGARQLRYRAPEFEIDLELEHTGDATGSVSILGQLVRQLPEGGAWGGAEFRLLADDEEVQRGVTNRLGEFEAKCAWHPNLRLQLADRDHRVLVEVPLGTTLRTGPFGSV